MFRRTLVVVATLLSTQVWAAGCIGLSKVEKDKCLQAIVSGVPQMNSTQTEQERVRYEEARFSENSTYARMKSQADEIDAKHAREARIQQQLQAQEQARQQQQQAAAEQARRDAVAEATLQQLRYNAQQQEIANQQAQQAPKPAARRPMNCYTYGGGYMHCD